MNNLLNTKEVAKILGISRRTLIRWEKQGRLISQRTSGNHRRYALEQIDKFKEAKKIAKANRWDELKKVNQYLIKLSSVKRSHLVKGATFIKELIGVLDRRQKIVYASFIGLFLILSVGVVAMRVVRPTIPGVLRATWEEGLTFFPVILLIPLILVILLLMVLSLPSQR